MRGSFPVLQLVGKSGSPLPPPFRDLRIRPKLIVLHNVFFLVLTAAVYYSVIPLVRDYAAGIERREAELLAEKFLAGRAPLNGGPVSPDERLVSRRPAEIGADAEIAAWLDAHPGQVWLEEPGRLFWKDPEAGEYAFLRYPAPYQGALVRAKVALFVTLGAIYLLAVLALELIIMPRYVYRPISAHQAADDAVQRGDREKELIDGGRIPGDEIGDIMRSRNATVRKLRELAKALQAKNDQLESAKRGLAAQDRLATLGRLSASVAHELNTPLSVIRGTIEKLLETVEDRHDRSRLERLARMTERLRRISESLLDFSRARRSEERKPVDVRRLFDEAWSLLELDERAAGVSFENAVDPNAVVQGDYDRLIQVAINLLRNAVYALDGGGRITVRAEPRRDDGRDVWAIQVDDTGSGIPEDVLPSIFEAFVSSRLDSRGTGLGLTVADGIVQRHGGRIVAENRPEGGARLEVTLPAAEREA